MVTPVDPARPPSADLSVTKTAAPAQLFVGEDLTYTIVVTNAGPSLATGVIMTDLLPAGTAFVTAGTTQGTVSESGGVVTAMLGELSSGAMATVTIIVRPTIPGTLSNVATVAGQQPDPNPDNNTTLPVLTPVSPAPVGPTADLTVTKTGLSAAIVGQSLTYTITASNLGPNADPSVVLEDVLPAGVTFVSSSIPPTTQTAGSLSFNLGSLAVGTSVTVTLVVVPNVPGTIANQSIVEGSNPRPQSLEQFGNGADRGRPSPADHGCETSAFRLPSPSHTPGPHFQCSTGASNGTSRGQLSTRTAQP